MTDVTYKLKNILMLILFVIYNLVKVSKNSFIGITHG